MALLSLWLRGGFIFGRVALCNIGWYQNGGVDFFNIFNIVYIWCISSPYLFIDATPISAAEFGY